MSSPLQPWPSGQDRHAGPPSGYGTPPASGPVNGYGTQAYAPTPANGAGPAYGVPQGYGASQQQPYGAGPSGELVVNLRKPFGAMGMISPIVTIDGHPAPCQWGRNAFQAPAGVRQIDVAQTYLWTYGRASMPVVVQPGTSSEIFYTGPLWTFGMGGAIGTEPQKRPGMGLFLGIMLFVLVVLVIAVVAGVAAGS